MRWFIIFLALYLEASTFYVKPGWQLLGSGKDNINQNAILNSSTKIVWRYKDGKWYALSNDTMIKKKLNELNITSFDKIYPKEGFWVYSNSSTTFNGNNEANIKDTLMLKKGWQLVSSPLDKDMDISRLDKDSIVSIWSYKDKVWSGYSPDKIKKDAIKIKYNILDTFNSDRGYWIQSNNESNISLYLYGINLFCIDNNKIKPLRYENVYDEKGKLVAKSDIFGFIKLNDTKTLFLSDKYNFSPLVMSGSKKDYILVAQMDKEVKSNSTIEENATKVIDMGDSRYAPYPLPIFEAKVAPIVFTDFSGNYFLIIREFYTDKDITLSIIPTDDTQAVGAFEISLEDSSGNVISIDEAQFSGEFKPVMKYDGNESRFVLMSYSDGSWQYLCDAYLLNGKIYPKKYVSSIGKYGFFSKKDIYTHTVCSNVKSIVFDESFYPRVADKCVTFYSFKKDEKVTLIANGYKEKTIEVNSTIANVTLEKKPLVQTCFILKDLNNTVVADKTFKIKYKDKDFDGTTDSSGKMCITAEGNISSIVIDDINYTINDKIYLLNPYKTIDSGVVTYANLVGDLLPYNSKTGVKLLNISTLKETNLTGSGFYFDAHTSSSIGTLFADTSDEIYLYDNNHNLIQSDFSKDDFFEDIGNFFTSGVSGKEHLFFPTSNAFIMITNLDGNNSYTEPIKLQTNDNNDSNDLTYLQDINDTNAYAIVYEGLIYMLNKSDKNATLITSSSTPLNLYNTQMINDKLYYIDDNELKYIEGKSICQTNIKAKTIKADDTYIAIDTSSKIDIYDKDFNLKNTINATNLLKIFEIGSHRCVVTREALYIDNQKATFQSDIANVDTNGNYLVIELKNAKIILVKF